MPVSQTKFRSVFKNIFLPVPVVYTVVQPYGCRSKFRSTAVPGHVRPTGTDYRPRQFPSKFRNSLRLSSTFHILGRHYMESTTKNLIINTTPFYCKFLVVLSIYWEDNEVATHEVATHAATRVRIVPRYTAVRVRDSRVQLYA